MPTANANRFAGLAFEDGITLPSVCIECCARRFPKKDPALGARARRGAGGGRYTYPFKEKDPHSDVGYGVVGGWVGVGVGAGEGWAVGRTVGVMEGDRVGWKVPWLVDGRTVG